MLLHVHELLPVFFHVSVCVIVYVAYVLAYLSRCACVYEIKNNNTKTRMYEVHDIPADKFDEQFHKPDTQLDGADEVSQQTIAIVSLCKN